MTAPTLLEQLGPRLRSARQKALLTVREAADRIGVGHSAIVRYEQGDVVPPLDRLIALANTYQVSLVGLLITDSALLPVITMLERSGPAEITLFTTLVQQAIDQSELEASQ